MQAHVSTPSIPIRQRIQTLRIDPYVYVLCLIPLCVLWWDSNPVFTQIGNVDPWVYYGYFRNLAAFKRDLFPSTYYGSRLAWLVPGYLVNKVFTPLAANYVLHLSVFYAALLALYSLIKTAANRQAALLGAMLFGFYPYVWMATGWDYCDGAGIAWFLITLVLLTRASSAPRRYGSLIVAGVCCSALIFSNLTWSLVCPGLLVYYLVLCKVNRRLSVIRALVEMTVWFGLGIGVVTASLCLINHALDGKYWFYAPSVVYATSQALRANPWKVPMSQWILDGNWLFIPFATIVISTIVAAYRRKQFFSRRNLLAILFVGQFLIAAGVMWWFDAKGDPLLQLPYYASYLIPFVFLTLGSLLLPSPKLSGAQFGWAVLSGFVAMSVPFWGLTDEFWKALRTPLWPYGVALLIIFAGGILFGRRPGLIAVLATTAVFYSWVHYKVSYQYHRPHLAKGSFLRLSDDIRQIENVRQERPIRFWYDLGDPYGREFYSLNSIYLFAYTSIGSKFPLLPDNVSMPAGTVLVVPSSNKDALVMAQKSYRINGQVLNLISRAEIAEEGGSYTLLFLEETPDLKNLQELTASFDGKGDGTLSVPSIEEHLPLPKEHWQATRDTVSGGLIVSEGGGLRVRTAPGPWTYATRYASLRVPADGRYEFLLDYRMLFGHMYFGVQKGDQSGWVTGVTVSKVTNQIVRVACSASLHKGEKIWLLTTNSEPETKQASSYVIEGLRVFRYLEP